jgi:hypothetical protein
MIAGRTARALVLLAAAACLAGPAGAAPGVRDPWLWPFVPSSEWNLPLGSGATFSAPDAPISRDLRAGVAIIHAGEWSHPVYLARADDPVVDIYDKENNRHFRARVPPSARPDPKWDAHMYVVDPTHHWVIEMYGTKILPDQRITTVRAFRVDLYGTGMHLTDGKYPGIRAMDASGFGGLIRAWELRAGRIRHAVTFLLPFSRLRHGPVWPSRREDYWGFRDYKGNVPIGTLIAIPPSVDISRLGLSRGGQILARALQDYGAYCDDSSGTNGITLSAEGASEGMPELAEMRADFPRIRGLLLAVTNNTPATPGGGGARREPPAPPLDPHPGS